MAHTPDQRNERSSESRGFRPERGSLRNGQTWHRGLIFAAIAWAMAWLAVVAHLGSILANAFAAPGEVSAEAIQAALGAGSTQLLWQFVVGGALSLGWVAYFSLPVRDAS